MTQELHMIRVDGDGCECGPTHLALMTGDGHLPDLAVEFATKYGVDMVSPDRYDAEGNHADDLPLDARLAKYRATREIGDKARAMLRAEGILTEVDVEWVRLNYCFVRWLVAAKGWTLLKPTRWLMPYEDDYVLPVRPENLREWDL
jgi:hypothetical protein